MRSDGRFSRFAASQAGEQTGPTRSSRNGCARDPAGPGWLADPDRDIDIVARKVDRSMRSRKPHLDPGMRSTEIIEPRDQPAHHECCEARYDQRALPRSHRNLRRAGFQPMQRLAHKRKQRQPGLRQFDTPIEATKQRHAQVVLEQLHLPADRTVRYMQFLGRRAKTQPIGGDLECRQGLEGRKLTTHLQLIRMIFPHKIRDKQSFVNALPGAALLCRHGIEGRSGKAKIIRQGLDRDSDHRCYAVARLAPPMGGLTPLGQAVLGATFAGTVLWVSEAVPLGVTAILVLALLGLVSRPAIAGCGRRLRGGRHLSSSSVRWPSARRWRPAASPHAPHTFSVAAHAAAPRGSMRR